MTEFSDITQISELLGIRTEDCHFVYTTQTSVLEAIQSQSEGPSPAHRAIVQSLDIGLITWEQAVLAMDRYDFAPDILACMGLKEDGHVAAKSVILPQSEGVSATRRHSLDI